MKPELYILPDCPFCIRVLDHIEENSLDDRIEIHDIAENPEDEERLEELTGDTQVPALVSDGKPVLESEDIIAWLDDHLVERKAG